jgi:hypothetical protein
MRKLVILILFLGFFLISLDSVSAVISCGSQTYPDGTGYCCDQGNGANGVWFRGDYYNSCPSGTFRYVSNSGNDVNLGTFSQPWKTISKVNNVASGEVVIFLGGTYNEAPTRAICEAGGILTMLDLLNSGNATNPIILKGHPDYPRPNFMGFNAGAGYTAGDGNTYSRAICMTGKTGITIDHIEVQKAYCGGIAFFGGDHIIVQDSIINYTVGTTGNNCAGIRFDYDTLRNVIVRGNEIYDVFTDKVGGFDRGEPGITFYKTANATIENNYFHNLGGGVLFKNQVTNSTFRRNICKDLDVFCFASQCVSTSAPYVWSTRDNDIYENVIYNSSNAPANRGAVDLSTSTEADGCNGYDPENVRVFNNVLYTGGSAGINILTLVQATSPIPFFRNFKVLNNIVVNYQNPSFPREQNMRIKYPNNIPGFVSNNNLWYDSGEDDVILYNDVSPIWYNLSEWKTASISSPVGAQDQNSKQQNPNFLSTNPSSPDFLRPNATSPAIDAGVKVSGYHCNVSASIDPSQTGCKLWYGLAPDIGAYEYNPGLPTVTCTTVDVNDDLKINILDLALVSYWQGTPVTSNYQHLDVNADGSINFGDVNEVLMRVGQNC